jgi:cytochrome c oxidase subunit 3
MSTAEVAVGGADRGAATASGGADPEREATVGVGLAIGFAAVIMTFAALLLAYGTVRVQAHAWPPPGEPALPSAMWPWPAAATVAALLASVAMRRAARRLHPRRPRGAAPLESGGGSRRALAATALACAAFVVIQVSGARHLLALGLRPSSGIALSVAFALTAFHGLHALGATLAVSVLGARVGRGHGAGRAQVGATAAFVDLVTVLWLVICAAVFVL